MCYACRSLLPASDDFRDDKSDTDSVSLDSQYYEVDELDLCWLESVNQKRKFKGLHVLSTDICCLYMYIHVLSYSPFLNSCSCRVLYGLVDYLIQVWGLVSRQCTIRVRDQVLSVPLQTGQETDLSVK